MYCSSFILVKAAEISENRTALLGRAVNTGLNLLLVWGKVIHFNVREL